MWFIFILICLPSMAATIVYNHSCLIHDSSKSKHVIVFKCDVIEGDSHIAPVTLNAVRRTKINVAGSITIYRLCIWLNVYNSYMAFSGATSCKRIMFLLIMTIRMWGTPSSSAKAHKSWSSRFTWGHIITWFRLLWHVPCSLWEQMPNTYSLIMDGVIRLISILLFSWVSWQSSILMSNSRYSAMIPDLIRLLRTWGRKALTAQGFLIWRVFQNTLPNLLPLAGRSPGQIKSSILKIPRSGNALLKPGEL